jgi:UDP:flavonoid glycosyltransferase YjiC (YdhE family)
MKRILVVPLGVGLAHVGRSIMIARELKRRRFQVFFGIGDEGIDIVKREEFDYFELPEFNRVDYDDKLKKNNISVYNKKIFNEFLAAELRLYKNIKPDLVIFDTRLTAKISTYIAKIPSVSISNVDVSGYYDFSKIKFPTETTLFKISPRHLNNILRKKYSLSFLNRIGPHIFQSILLKETLFINSMCLKYGYKMSSNPYQLFLGNLTLLCDIAEFRPIKQLNNAVKLVGPIFWDGGNKLPRWHGEIEKSKKKIIYVTASGTGDKHVFLKTLEYLKDSIFTVVATTGNTLKPNEVNIRYSNLYLTDYLPGNWIMPKAQLVIFPGGNSTVYQALNFGVPQICTPLHFDQEDNANNIERLGVGLTVYPHLSYTKDDLLNAIGRLTVDKSIHDNADRMKKVMAGYNGVVTAAEEIEKYIH